MKTILFLVFLVCLIVVVIKKDTIWMPMSWNDSTNTYEKCFNCETYLYLSSGGHESCEGCPFYCTEKPKELDPQELIAWIENYRDNYEYISPPTASEIVAKIKEMSGIK